MRFAPRIAITLVVASTVAGCALWNPFDHDHYTGQADAVVVINNQECRASWTFPISRESSFNPYSTTGRQDGWRFDWGGSSIELPDGTCLWIDASKSVSEAEAERLLGITGAQPIPRAHRSPDVLAPSHPLTVDEPVYVSAASGRPATLVPYHGDCGGSRASCRATIRFSVPLNYVGPYDRNPANYLGLP